MVLSFLYDFSKDIYDKLLEVFKEEIKVRPIYLRDNRHPILKIKVSNQTDKDIVIHNIFLMRVNGEKPRSQVGREQKNKIKPKDFQNYKLEFEGGVKKGHNDIRLSLTVEDYEKITKKKKDINVELDEGVI